ncbi:MAG: patatin-like phospholipase family protein [Acidobacteriota bacterium]|nr:patatin-like phospholipase family protein [Blastocatellia bacterium]MDW8413643.1 patatin-like phospholipase family protein [Acidobacteriota bacterium]
MRPKIGLALSGGGARGLAHIGVLKVLEEHQFPIDFIAGTSMGAVIAGTYASGMELSQIEEVARSVRWRDVTRMVFSRLGLMSSEPLEQMLRRLMPVTDFAKMRIKLAVVAADIQTGLPVMLTEGDAAHAIRVSCTIPGIFTPVLDSKGRMLVDGGLAQNLPVTAVKQLGAERVIAVDVNSSVAMDEPPKDIFQIILQSLMIIGRTSSQYQAMRADLLLQPIAGRVRVDELERAPELIAAGERVMRQAMPAAMQLLDNRRVSLWERVRGKLLNLSKG